MSEKPTMKLLSMSELSDSSLTYEPTDALSDAIETFRESGEYTSAFVLLWDKKTMALQYLQAKTSDGETLLALECFKKVFLDRVAG